MLTVTNVSGFSDDGDMTLLGIIRRCGLENNLQVCLDAADTRSFASTGQSTWKDARGSGHDFFRGTTSTPNGQTAFVGLIGQPLAESTYMKTNIANAAGGYLYANTYPTWFNNMITVGGKYTIMAHIYFPALPASSYSANLLCSVPSGSSDTNNIIIQMGDNASSPDNTNTFQILTDYAGSAGSIAYYLGTTSVTTGWNFIGISVDDTVPSVVELVNGVTASSSNRITNHGGTTTPSIFMNVDGTLGDSVQVDQRLSCMGIWAGTALTAAQMLQIYKEFKPRL